MYISSLFLAYVDSNPPINTGSSSPSNNLMLTSFTIENGLPQIGEFSFGDPVPVTGGQSSKAAPAFFTESYVNNPVPPSSPLFLA